ncbi:MULTISPECIES: hypothetical protein [unclassified Microcoleus]|uniref:hypothetical protein n=1 Tax=unclassified Microcoleus TaxID=2642155 RepID=UPI002FCFCA91
MSFVGLWCDRGRKATQWLKFTITQAHKLRYGGAASPGSLSDETLVGVEVEVSQLSGRRAGGLIEWSIELEDNIQQQPQK